MCRRYHRLRTEIRALITEWTTEPSMKTTDTTDRQRGITEAWLLSIGFIIEWQAATKVFTIEGDWHQVQIRGGKVFLVDRQGTFIQLGLALTTTRGMMLDQLAALKIPIKAKESKP